MWTEVGGRDGEEWPLESDSSQSWDPGATLPLSSACKGAAKALETVWTDQSLPCQALP